MAYVLGYFAIGLVFPFLMIAAYRLGILTYLHVRPLAVLFGWPLFLGIFLYLYFRYGFKLGA